MRCLLLLVLVLVTVARAEEITLSRSEAFELHSALSQLAPGLAPENTIAAADDINALDANSKSVRAGYAKLLQLQQVVEAAKTAEGSALLRSSDERLTAALEERKTYQLARFAVSKEEIKAANITPATLAVIRRFLAPPNK